ncbi:patatin-like phospholipase family protein [Kribbella sp. NPDC050820]|uniref:patatin-like phospholipase family protein n=1 Tax=Kribbella sp. NPDC050820 TaxID=3155408 RepID=UPI0033ED305B
MVAKTLAAPMSGVQRPKIGLAFSGGGSRAAAFGLGALRALHDRNLLGDVEVVSGISGGSLLSALWAYGPSDFDEFDESVTRLLSRGLQTELIRRAFSPRRAAANLTSGVAAALPGRNRRSTRTESLVDTLAARSFGRKTMPEVTQPGLDVIISATDLSTANAVRFGSKVSSCSPYGVISEPVPVADAVAASAAFPALLPQLNRSYTFTQSDGTVRRKTMLMTDGGIYDNLGLTPLLPGRSSAFTSHVYDLDYLIAIDAGSGRTTPRAPNRWLFRMKRSLEIAHIRNQDGTRALVHQLAESGRLKGIVYSYLGMNDARLPRPLKDLVPRQRVFSYRTNFAKMSPENLAALTTRGEQLTRTLIDAYCPELGR